MSASDQPIVMLLERIAIALEKLADQKQPTVPPVDTLKAITPIGPFRCDSDNYRQCRAWARQHGAPGVRAEKAIAKAGICSFEEVNLARLRDLKNCGEVTIQALLEWAESKST